MKGELPDDLSEKPQTLFAIISITIGLIVGIVVAEWVLSYQRQFIETSDNMEPGMILYDSQLGWKLKPYWSGAHQHYDYEVTYNINREGFRGSDKFLKDSNVSIIGDSFSFGLGVNDNQTFSSLLNNNHGDKLNNYSVPGYSTDQQLLLLNRYKNNIKQQVFLVVYLGNDIFDNMRRYPLQAEHGKPYFKLAGEMLSLENTPVPLQQKSAAASNESISSIVLGDDAKEKHLSDWFSQFEISRRLGLFQRKVILSAEDMHSRFNQSLLLFIKLILKMESIIAENDGYLNVVLLPGRSYVELPDSLSAQYQEYFRKQIIASFDKASPINLMDLATHLRTLDSNGVENMYYPNEGHLTPLGHQHVADYLAEKIDTINNKK